MAGARRGSLLESWASFKATRHAQGMPTIGGSPGELGLVPMAEAAFLEGGDAAAAQFSEAAVPSDFPFALGNTLYREMIQWFTEIDEPWRNYFWIGENIDFRPKMEIMGAELEDLLPVPVGAEYKDSSMTDQAFTLTLSVFGRLFSVQRETIINDDLGLLRDLPAKMARQVARTLSKYMTRSTMEANLNSYDGTPVFTSGHGNLQSGAGSALGAASLSTAVYTMQTQVGDLTLNPSGGPIGIAPVMLVVPPALEFTARQLINSTLIVAAGGAQPNTTYGNVNPLQNLLTIIVDRWLTSPSAWYVYADPAEAPAWAATFLRGKPNPDLLVERPRMTSLAGGGDDPYEIEVDRLVYKARHQWGSSGALWWGGYKSAGV